MEKKIILSLNEKALILAIRERFRYGEVIVIVKNGKPVYIKRAWESDNLDDKDLTPE
jgi:hypothetical protein